MNSSLYARDGQCPFCSLPEESANQGLVCSVVVVYLIYYGKAARDIDCTQKWMTAGDPRSNQLHRPLRRCCSTGTEILGLGCTSLCAGCHSPSPEILGLARVLLAFLALPESCCLVKGQMEIL